MCIRAGRALIVVGTVLDGDTVGLNLGSHSEAVSAGHRAAYLFTEVQDTLSLHHHWHYQNHDQSLHQNAAYISPINAYSGSFYFLVCGFVRGTLGLRPSTPTLLQCELFRRG